MFGFVEEFSVCAASSPSRTRLRFLLVEKVVMVTQQPSVPSYTL
jgi:hypothetical protein